MQEEIKENSVIDRIREIHLKVKEQCEELREVKYL